MATTKVCDRCGAVINHRDSGMHIYIVPGSCGYRVGKEEANDLCVSCAYKLKQFLRGRKLEEMKLND